MQSERESIIRLCSSKSEVSSHFIINEKGQAYRLVEDNKIAWHAGKSCWGKYRNLNKNSIGIELVNKGHRFGYTNSFLQCEEGFVNSIPSLPLHRRESDHLRIHRPILLGRFQDWRQRRSVSQGQPV